MALELMRVTVTWPVATQDGGSGEVKKKNEKMKTNE